MAAIAAAAAVAAAAAAAERFGMGADTGTETDAGVGVAETLIPKPLSSPRPSSFLAAASAVVDEAGVAAVAVAFVGAAALADGLAAGAVAAVGDDGAEDVSTGELGREPVRGLRISSSKSLLFFCISLSLSCLIGLLLLPLLGDPMVVGSFEDGPALLSDESGGCVFGAIIMLFI